MARLCERGTWPRGNRARTRARTQTHTHKHKHTRARTLIKLLALHSNLSRLCCNSSPLFNKQFVSDVSNASPDLIVCEMCMEVPACSPSPPSHPLSLQRYFTLSFPSRCVRACACVSLRGARTRMLEQSLRVCNYI